MPTMKSAKKRLRQNIKRNLRNRSRKSALRTQIKHFLGVVKEGNIPSAEEKLRLAIKKIRQSSSEGDFA